jgi:hypothetical protein
MALTVQQTGQAARVIAVDRRVVEVAGRLYSAARSFSRGMRLPLRHCSS